MKIFVDIFLRGWWGSTKLDNFFFLGGGHLYSQHFYGIFEVKEMKENIIC